MPNQLKEEGRAGLLYALDANRNNIPAEDAFTGEKYRCPVCDCEMHVCRTPSGKHIFARNAGKQHTDGRCISYESKSIKHTFDNLNPERFIESLCHVSPKKGNPPNGNGGMPKSPNGDEDIKTSSFRPISFSP